MIAASLAAYLATCAIPGFNYQPTATTGTVFIDHMPDKPDVAVALFNYPGPAPDVKHGYDSPRVQVRVRCGLDPRTAQELMAAIYTNLHDLRQVNLTDNVWLIYCRAMQSGAMPLGPDRTGQRLEFTQNYECHIRNVTKHRE